MSYRRRAPIKITGAITGKIADVSGGERSGGAVDRVAGHGPPAEPADSTESLDSVDLLLANLPYIPSAMVPTLPVAASFEPRSALDGGQDGLAIIRRLIARLPAVLKEDGAALLEIGSDQAGAVQALVAELGNGWSSVVQLDLTGSARVIEIGRGVD